MTGSSEDQSSAEATGSPSDSEPVFLAIGKLHRPHGIRGEMVMEVLTDFPERLQPGIQLYVGPDRMRVRLVRIRPHPHGLLVSFEGYETPEKVGVFRNQIVYVQAADRPALPEGEYYHHQLLGLGVYTGQGQYLGKLTGILETGANDVFVIQPERGPEVLIPNIDPIILHIDLEKGKMLINPFPGLLPADENPQE